MTPLAVLLQERIVGEGPLSVAAYMEMCLAHPRHGYYRKKDPLGRGGDFITAPEISQMFGEIVGVWCLLTWQSLGMPASFVLAEVGPGRGTLMVDALRAAKVIPDFGRAAQVHLVETSPALRAVQKAALKAYAPVWHDDFGILPDGPLLLIGNEFLDALPIRQFQKQDGAWCERLVGWDAGQGFHFVSGAPSVPPFSPSAKRLADAAPDGAVLETCEAARLLVASLAQRLQKFGGAALFIDYGPAHSGLGDSLQALKAHRYHPVLDDPGDADLTAHVDFETLRNEATACGLKAFGPVPQGDWLHALGISQRAERLAQTASPEQREALQAAYHRLTHPDQMGHLFKTLVLTSSSME